MIASKILSREQLLEAAARARAAGKTVVFANGAFDLLHVGHVRYLAAARQEGGWLAVGVNADASVRLAKGLARPILPEAERAEIVAALEAVDAVVLFDEDSPAALIAALRPDVHAKGTDYTAATVPERAVVAGYGGRTVIVGDPKDHATTDVIERVRQTSESDASRAERGIPDSTARKSSTRRPSE
ncbi:MAG TPA: adenylyltransferase/cytidyltransferase family protein [Thermoanaerobaculia bacterium]